MHTRTFAGDEERSVAALPNEVSTAVLPAQSAGSTATDIRIREVPARGRRRRPRRVTWLPDTAILAGYLACAFWVLGHLVVEPNQRIIAANGNDQAFFEWTLAHGARVLAHGANPFFSTQLGSPDGVNLMANTSILGLSLPLAPLTLLVGTRVTFLVLLLVALFATATSWYALFTRAMRLDRGPAALGAALCGLGPAMVSHTNAHPNIVAQFLLPWIFWQLLALARGVRPVRAGLILAALVTWQFFINEELLFITGLTFACFGAAWLAQRPVGARLAVRQLLRGLLLPVAVLLPALAYPLWVQFFGAQHYRGMSPQAQDFGTDLVAFFSFASRSVGGSPLTIGHVAQNAAEENTFLGIPLLVLLALCCWYLRRRPVVPALACAAVALSVLSLGAHLRVQGVLTRVPGPYYPLRHVPLFDTMIPTRLALAVTPLAGVLLALGCAQLFPALRAAGRPGGVPVRPIAIALLVAALAPLTPTPLRATDAPYTPHLITSGAWRAYVPAGSALVTVPLPQPYSVAPMRWAAVTGDELRLAGGYFLGPLDHPGQPDDRQAAFTPAPRPTAALFDAVATSGQTPPIGPADLVRFRADMAYWRSSVLVMAPGRHRDLLWQVVTTLVGAPPVWADGLWLWTLRS